MAKPFVSETIIDQKAALLSPPDNAIIALFKETQSAALGYIFSESFSVLTQEEKEYLLYLSLVIWQSCEQVFEETKEISPEEIEIAEERNWTMLTESSAKNFRDKLNDFFEGYAQEDLLAFVEDSLVISQEGDESDDFEVTKEGREPIFIALTTLIDCWAI